MRSSQDPHPPHGIPKVGGISQTWGFSPEEQGVQDPYQTPQPGVPALGIRNPITSGFENK